VSGVEYVRGRLSSAPVVLLPGLFAGAWMWKPTWDCLIGAGHSVLQIPEPFAALDTKAVSIGALRSMLIGVLDEHEISGAVLCGNSLGGLVALDTARHHPDRVEALVVSGCPGLSETANLGLRHSGDMSRENADRIADQLFYDRSGVSEEMIERSYALARDRRCAINMLRYVLAIRKYDLRNCLPQIRCDVLLVWGEHDRIAPVEDWEQNLHLIARTSLRKLARCGHSPMIEKPAEFNAILTEFLNVRLSGQADAPVRKAR
jgi:2-hydroxy-6-oxonona-2,4-dienedioate hydrolase